MWLHLHLADCIIFPKGPALLPVVLTIQRRPSPKLMFMFPDKNLQFLQCLTKFPSLLQAQVRFLLLTQMCLIVVDAFQAYHTISMLIQVSHPSKPLPTSPCSSERVFQTRLTRCYKQEFWSQLIKQCLRLIVLFLFKVKISLEISSWESVWILQIWTKQLCMSHTISRPLKILPIILQRLV